MVKPISQMPRDLLRRVDKIETAIERSKRETLRAAAMAAKNAQQDVMTADAGGDLVLGRVRSGKGAKIGARFTVVGDSVTVQATGPVPLVANAMPPHAIPKTGARLRRQRKRLAIPGVGVRMSVSHLGTKGKDTWNEGRKRAEPRVKTVIGRRTDGVVRRAFRSGG